MPCVVYVLLFLFLERIEIATGKNGKLQRPQTSRSRSRHRSAASGRGHFGYQNAGTKWLRKTQRATNAKVASQPRISKTVSNDDSFIAMQSLSFKDRISGYNQSLQSLETKDRKRISRIKKRRRRAAKDKIENKEQQKRATKLFADFIIKQSSNQSKNQLINDILSFQLGDSDNDENSNKNSNLNGKKHKMDDKPLTAWESAFLTADKERRERNKGNDEKIKKIDQLTLEDCVFALKSLNVYHEIYVPINPFERWSKRAKLDNIFTSAIWDFFQKNEEAHRKEKEIATKIIKKTKKKRKLRKQREQQQQQEEEKQSQPSNNETNDTNDAKTNDDENKINNDNPDDDGGYGIAMPKHIRGRHNSHSLARENRRKSAHSRLHQEEEKEQRKKKQKQKKKNAKQKLEAETERRNQHSSGNEGDDDDDLADDSNNLPRNIGMQKSQSLRDKSIGRDRLSSIDDEMGKYRELMMESPKSPNDVILTIPTGSASTSFNFYNIDGIDSPSANSINSTEMKENKLNINDDNRYDNNIISRSRRIRNRNRNIGGNILAIADASSSPSPSPPPPTGEIDFFNRFEASRIGRARSLHGAKITLTVISDNIETKSTHEDDLDSIDAHMSRSQSLRSNPQITITFSNEVDDDKNNNKNSNTTTNKDNANTSNNSNNSNNSMSVESVELANKGDSALGASGSPSDKKETKTTTVTGKEEVKVQKAKEKKIDKKQATKKISVPQQHSAHSVMNDRDKKGGTKVVVNTSKLTTHKSWDNIDVRSGRSRSMVSFKNKNKNKNEKNSKYRNKKDKNVNNSGKNVSKKSSTPRKDTTKSGNNNSSNRLGKGSKSHKQRRLASVGNVGKNPSKNKNPNRRAGHRSRNRYPQTARSATATTVRVTFPSEDKKSKSKKSKTTEKQREQQKNQDSKSKKKNRNSNDNSNNNNNDKSNSNLKSSSKPSAGGDASVNFEVEKQEEKETNTVRVDDKKDNKHANAMKRHGRSRSVKMVKNSNKGSKKTKENKKQMLANITIKTDLNSNTNSNTNLNPDSNPNGNTTNQTVTITKIDTNKKQRPKRTRKRFAASANATRVTTHKGTNDKPAGRDRSKNRNSKDKDKNKDKHKDKDKDKDNDKDKDSDKKQTKRNTSKANANIAVKSSSRRRTKSRTPKPPRLSKQSKGSKDSKRHKRSKHGKRQGAATATATTPTVTIPSNSKSNRSKSRGKSNSKKHSNGKNSSSKRNRKNKQDAIRNEKANSLSLLVTSFSSEVTSSGAEIEMIEPHPNSVDYFQEKDKEKKTNENNDNTSSDEFSDDPEPMEHNPFDPTPELPFIGSYSVPSLLDHDIDGIQLGLNSSPIFGRSKSERSPLSLPPLKDADMPVGMDSIINQTIDDNSNVENSDNNDNTDNNDNNHSNDNNNNTPSSNNIDALSKPPNKAGRKSPVYSPRLRAHDDLDIKLKNVSIDNDNDGDISTTDLEIDLSEIDSSDIGTDVESLTSPTEGSKLTQANVSILQSLLLSPKNESKSISFDPHKGVSSRHKTFQAANSETKPKNVQFRSVTPHSRNKLVRLAKDNALAAKENNKKRRKDLKLAAQTPDGTFASASQYFSFGDRYKPIGTDSKSVGYSLGDDTESVTSTNTIDSTAPSDVGSDVSGVSGTSGMSGMSGLSGLSGISAISGVSTLMSINSEKIRTRWNGLSNYYIKNEKAYLKHPTEYMPMVILRLSGNNLLANMNERQKNNFEKILLMAIEYVEYLYKIEFNNSNIDDSLLTKILSILTKRSEIHKKFFNENTNDNNENENEDGKNDDTGNSSDEKKDENNGSAFETATEEYNKWLNTISVLNDYEFGSERGYIYGPEEVHIDNNPNITEKGITNVVDYILMDCPHLRILQCTNMNDLSTTLCGQFVNGIKLNNHILKCSVHLRYTQDIHLFQRYLMKNAEYWRTMNRINRIEMKKEKEKEKEREKSSEIDLMQMEIQMQMQMQLQNNDTK